MNNSSTSQSELENNEYALFEFILHGIITNMVALVGLLGNCVCIAVLRRPQMRHNSTNVILATLATFDAILIVTSVLMLGLPAIYQYSGALSWYYHSVYPYVIPWVYAIGLTAQTGSIYCTLGVTVERYIVVCWPLRSATICTYGKVKLAVTGIVCFSILYNIPRFFEVSWEAGGVPEMTSLRQNEYYISIYITWMYLVFMYVLPFGGLSVLNMLIFLDVRRSNKNQSTMSANEKKELRLAVMLMIVVVVFLICNILPLIVNILEVLDQEINEITETSNLLVTVNSSVNFFIYIIFGEKFKKQLWQILPSCDKTCWRRSNRHQQNPAANAAARAEARDQELLPLRSTLNAETPTIVPTSMITGPHI